jgi:transmembrane protein TMEM260 (protein O-mannosyltransferase)
MRTKLALGLFAALLCFFIISTRLHYKFPYLYSWDSVQFALSIEHFDVIKHQPHPPGYIFYSFGLKFLDSFVKDPNLTMIYVNIAATIFGSVFLFVLIFEIASDSDLKLRLLLSCTAAAIYATNPIVWFYGCVSEIYAVEAWLVSALCYLLLLSIRRPELLLLTSILFGLAGGIRLTTEVFLFPVYLYVIFKANKKIILLSLFCLVISNLLWFIPIVILTGGIRTYIGAVLNQGLRESSITAGFKFRTFLEISASLLQAITIPLLLLILIRIKSIRIKQQELFLFIAILPALFFFLLIHFPKHGYMMVVIPSLIALAISLIRNQQYNPVVLSPLLLLAILVNYFIFTKPPIRATGFLYQFTFPNRHVRNSQEERMEAFFNKISKFGDKKKIFVIEKGYFPNFRFVMYYFPDDITLTSFSRKNAVIATNHQIETVPLQIPLKGDEKLVILIGPDPASKNFERFNVYEHRFYFAYINQLPKDFGVWSYQFCKE